LVEHLNKTIRTELELPLMDVEFEAFFDYWTTANSKNRNFGIITWPESKKGDLKVTGFGLKAANSSPLTRDIQRTMFRMISEGAEENDVSKEIRPISLALRKGEKSIEDLAPYGRLGKASYDRVPPNAAKGALYYNENMASNDPFRVGDSGQWVYVNGVPENFPTTNVVSFRDAEEIKDFSLDYDLMVEKFIRKKLEPIYEVLDWDLGFACGDKMPKGYW
jgi:DNA polymerase elongation subunit (family B)